MLPDRWREARRRPLFVATLVCAALIVFPYYWMFASSTSVESLFQWPPRIVPEHFTFEAFEKIFAERPIFQWLQNTASSPAAVFCTAVSINAGYALSRQHEADEHLRSSSCSRRCCRRPSSSPLYVIFRQLGLATR